MARSVAENDETYTSAANVNGPATPHAPIDNVMLSLVPSKFAGTAYVVVYSNATATTSASEV